MASIWTGAIAFGLVNIPVRVETAVRSHDLSFRLLAPKGKDDFCPVKYERVCKNDGKEVPWDEIVKGYEYEKDRFVVLTDEDFEKAALATNKTFEIQDFAPEGDVDPRFFEKPYYLIPQKGGERAYALLRDAMRNSGTLGIGTITLRKKQYLASIKPIGDAIILDAPNQIEVFSYYYDGPAPVYGLPRGLGGDDAQTFDRVLGLDTLYVNAMMLLLTFGMRTGSTLYFESALIIALLGFVATAALAKFLMRGEVIE